MARIRSVKPEFFQHEAIFEAERSSGLPLRLAYIGLWTQADRRGCFRWKPRELKLNVLPWDEIDFGAVLDALLSAGFVARYEVDGFAYGWIPSFTKHQVFNLKEKPSGSIPNPPVSVPEQCQNGAATVLTRMDREGKGREGKGRDLEGKGSAEGEPRRGATSAGGALAPRDKARLEPGHEGACQDPLCCEDGARNAGVLPPGGKP